MASRERLTFQEVVKRRQQEVFVGRDVYVASFRANLDLSLDDDQRKFIFAISGQGGIGKTWLLRRFRTLVDHHAGEAIQVWIDEKEETIISVMEHIAKEFERQGYPLKAFADRYRLYQQKRHELESAPDAPHGLANFVGKAAKFALRLGGTTPAAPLLQYVDEDIAVETVREFVEYISRKAANRDEARLVQNPVEVLSPLLVNDLNVIPESRLIAIYLDTYERTGEYLDEWIRDLLSNHYGIFPINVLLSIAGRRKLARNLWDQYEGVMQRISLDPFTEEEALEYLARKRVSNTRVSQTIMQLSERLPLLVATLAAESPIDPAQVGDPTGTAVERFLQWTEEPSRRQLAIDAALPRQLNQDIIAELSNTELASSLFEWLKGMPFVEESVGNGWYYHEVVRSQLLRHKRRQSPQTWRFLHERLAKYYAAQVSTGDSAIAMIPSEETPRRAKLAWLYHSLCQNSQGGLAEAANGFVVALIKSRTYAQHWADTICQAGIDSDARELRKLGEELAKAATGYRDRKHVDTIHGLSRLLELKVLTHSTATTARALRGHCYMMTHKNEQALSDINSVLEESPNEHKSWADRGFVYLETRKLDDALNNFMRAAELRPSNTSYLSLCALTLMLLKRFDEALEHINRAIAIAPDKPDYLVQRARIRAANKQFELTLPDLEHALKIDPTNAAVLVARGDAYVRLDKLENALQDYSDAIAIEPADADLLGKRAVVYGRLERYDESLEDSGQALAIDTRNAQLLSDRATTYIRMKRFNDALKDLQRAVQLHPNDMKIRIQQARVYLEMGDYESVLREVTAATVGKKMTLELANIQVVALMKTRRFAQAEEALSFIISSDSSSAEAYINRASIRNQIGHYDDALADLNAALAIKPNSSDLLARRADIFRLLGRYQEAIDEFEAVFSADESLRSTYATDYGLTLTYLGRYGEAMECYEQILAEDENDYPSLYNLAVAAVRLQLSSANSYVQAARAALQAVLDMDARGAALYGLGGLEALAGHSDAALELLAQSIPLESGSRAWARHDMAWEELRQDEKFRALVS